MPGFPNASPIYPCRGLVSCPPYESTLSNPNFAGAVEDRYEDADLPDNWAVTPGGYRNAGRLMSGGWRGPECYQLYPADGSSDAVGVVYEYSAAAFAAIFGDLRPGTDYRLRCAAACVTGGGGSLRLQVDAYDVGDGLVKSVATSVPLGQAPGLPADGVWRFCRSDALRLTPAETANLSYVVLSLIVDPPGGFVAAFLGDVDVRLDFVAFGAFVDTNDLGRLSPEDPFDVDLEGLFDDEMSTARRPFRASFHPDVPVGTFVVPGVQPGGEREAVNLLRAAGGGRPMSVMFDVTDLSKDYYSPVIHDGDNDGLTQGVGAFSDLAIPFRGTRVPA